MLLQAPGFMAHHGVEVGGVHVSFVIVFFFGLVFFQASPLIDLFAIGWCLSKPFANNEKHYAAYVVGFRLRLLRAGVSPSFSANGCVCYWLVLVQAFRK